MLISNQQPCETSQLIVKYFFYQEQNSNCLTVDFE